MIPGYLDVVAELPMLTSGKVDRNKLPAPQAPLVTIASKIIEPTTELERTVAAVWARVFGVPRISVEDDFFLDLGGHSLVAAKMITQLRNATTRHVTVRDAYSFPTIRKLAAHLEQMPERASSPANDPQKPAAPSSRAVFESQSRATRLLTASLQAASIYLMSGIAMIPFGILFLLATSWINGNISLTRLLGLTGVVTLLTWPVLLTFSIAAKWLIIGRYKPGSYPLWSFYYFRWWLVSRLQGFSGAGNLAGTPVLPLYFRLMGARVGHGCNLDTAACSIWDLVSIGDETSIGADTQLLGYRVVDGMLVIGSTQIGSRCFIGIHSALGLNVAMKDESRLDDQSLLADGQTIGACEARRGSPALPAVVNVPIAKSAPRHPILFGILHLALLEILPVLLLVPTLPFIAAFYYSYITSGLAACVAVLIASVPLGMLTMSLYLAALKRLVLTRAKPGVYSIESAFYLRKWFSDEIMKVSRTVLMPLYTTIYFPHWLRLLGAKIGARAELSTVWNFAPELIDVGEESFFADGSIIGGKRCFGGSFELGLNRIGRRSFVGNSAILPVGASLGDGCLLGVQSAPPRNQTCTPDGTDWLGSPAFQLPHRQKVGNFDDTVTFRPTPKLYLQRMIVDGLRIVIPGYIALTAAAMGTLMLYGVYNRFGKMGLFTTGPAIGLLLGFYAILVVVGLKKAVMGTFKPIITPLWSMYVWLNEMVNGAYESVMSPALAPFLGTPFIAPLLRLIGCKIGKHTFIETKLFSEFDLVQVGDYAALNAGAVIQNHLFEDRVMKSSYLNIGAECSVGNLAVILYDTDMHEGSVIGPLSLLMKGETLPACTSWHGIPTTQVTVQPPKMELVSSAPKTIRRRSLFALAASFGSGSLS